MRKKRVAAELWGAHASRVWAMASSPSRTFLPSMIVAHNAVVKDCFDETLKPTRETGALPRRAAFHAFTLIELLVVMTIILVLAGLILATSNYLQKKGYRSRAEAEIAAISAALENYKADNGVYPSTGDTAALLPNKMGDPTQSTYQKASLALYTLISGDTNNDANRISEDKSYFSFKPNQLAPTNQASAVLYIKDPFGNPYGYSTVRGSAPTGTDGYNPTFDLWSTAGVIDTINAPNQPQWIRNW